MIDLTPMSASALLELHADVLSELRRRGIVRSFNNPTGDYGELLFATAFGWTLSANAFADSDAVDSQGLRYQIKCRRLTPTNPSRQLGYIRRLPDRPFDELAAVLLDERYKVLRAALIPVEIVQRRATYVDSVKAWRLMLPDSTWSLDGVVDVTDRLKAAQAST